MVLDEIREATPRDVPELTEISRLTWEGDDYLEGVLADWIRSGGFYAATIAGRVVGAVKMSAYPDRVCWLEGLRVHPDHRGRGIAAELTDFVLDRARAMMRRDEVSSVEFATYYKNDASIHLGRSRGFRIAERFVMVSRRSGSGTGEAIGIEPPGLEEFAGYGSYLPSRWELCHRSEDGIRWLLGRGSFMKAGEMRFYTCPDTGDFCLVDFLPDGVPDLVPALDGICSKRGAEWQTLLIPESQSAMLESLKREGFSWWEQPEEPNLLVFSLPGDALAPGPGTG